MAQIRQRVKLNIKGVGNETIKWYAEGQGLPGEGVIRDFDAEADVHWTVFEMPNGTSRGLNLDTDEFDVVDEPYETMTLRLDTRTMNGLSDIFFDWYTIDPELAIEKVRSLEGGK